MQIDSATGLLAQARYVASPNADARPPGVEPELVVVHAISLPPGQYGGSCIDELFCNRLDRSAHPYFAEIGDLRVSAHALVRRCGEIRQYVPFHLRAWHAGQSEFCGRRGCNDFSVGIELEGCDWEPFEPVQYERLAELIAALEATYPGIHRDRLVGHSDIAPGRKTDPGPCFDWTRLKQLLNADP